jgi:hypothetical protein
MFDVSAYNVIEGKKDAVIGDGHELMLSIESSVEHKFADEIVAFASVSTEYYRRFSSESSCVNARCCWCGWLCSWSR